MPLRNDYEFATRLAASTKCSRFINSPCTGQTWRTFLRNHAADIWACDFLQLHDAWFRPLFAFVIRHGSRETVHVNVTRSTTDAWVAQQLREATCV